jgi:hypothetical protein
MRPAVKTALTDADKAVDFTSVIQGHVSQNIRQVFTVERTRLRVHRALSIEAMEHIVKDQFGNLYVVFTAKLMDGEVYACTAWIGAEKWTGMEKRIVLVKEWKRFPGFNDDLLAAIQNLAFCSFGNANIAILKGRRAAQLPAVTAAKVGDN